jgi:CheY-like chemotaxis protein
MPERTLQICRVLLVDDHVDCAVISSRFLRSCGYDVTVAHGYQSGWAAARAERFDVALLDLALLDGDGCDLFVAVKTMYPIRGIALTAYGHEVDRERCQRAGFDLYLMKPVSLDDLQSAIDEVADLQRL